jgi:hypothetical protein
MSGRLLDRFANDIHAHIFVHKGRGGKLIVDAVGPARLCNSKHGHVANGVLVPVGLRRTVRRGTRGRGLANMNEVPQAAAANVKEDIVLGRRDSPPNLRHSQ